MIALLLPNETQSKQALGIFYSYCLGENSFLYIRFKLWLLSVPSAPLRTAV